MDAAHLWFVLRYVEQNLVRAGLVNGRKLGLPKRGRPRHGRDPN